MKKRLNNPILHLIIGLIMLLSVQFGTEIFTTSHFNPKRFNTILNEKELFAEQELNKIAKTTSLDNLFININKYNTVFNKKGIAFFVFDNKRPIFWTNRSIYFSDNLNEFTKENGAVLLKNGWYQYIKKQKNNTIYLALILVKHQFNIKNKYLKNNFHSSYHFSEHADIVFKGGAAIKSINGEILFHLQKKEITTSFKPTNWLMVIAFLVGYLFIISFLSKQTRNIILFRKFSPIIVIAFIILSKLLMSYFQVPAYLFKQALFSPSIFAHSIFIPSLGEFLIAAVCFSIIVYYLSRSIQSTLSNNKYVAFLFILVSTLTPLLLADWLEGLIKNSKINFDVNYLLDLNAYSFVGIFCLLLFFVTIIILVKAIFNGFSNKAFKQNHFQNIYWTVALIVLLIGHFFFDLKLLFTFWFLAVIITFSLKDTSKTIFYSGVFFIVLISLTVAIGFIQFGKEKEIVNKAFWAKKLAKEQDPVVEYLFNGVKLKIQKDTVLINQLHNYWKQDNIDNYLKNNYFNGFWNKYDIAIYPCLANDSILVEPENKQVHCLAFFNNKVEKEAANPFQLNDNINFLYSASGLSSYLGKILIQPTPSFAKGAYLFIEFFPKTFSKYEGYPELLLDQKEINRAIDIDKYSFAKYKEKKLFANSGNFNYKRELNKTFRFNDKGFLSLSFEKFNHLIYQADEFATIILSSRKKTIFNYITTFSYLFIFTALLVLFIGVFFRIAPFKWQIAYTNFSIKLQFFIVSSTFLSFILFGWGTSYYIQKQYQIKNHKNIEEKVQSVLIELEHKLGDKKALTAALKSDMTYYLIKFSNVFYTDINLYDKQGALLASSRPEVFEQGLSSKKMNRQAYQQIHLNKKSNFIHNEKIGELEYLSAYVPFRNNNHEILAYMNLPYFAKQNELESELSNFFTALINIYGLLFLISTVITVFFASYISEPVRMIKDKISALQLGKSYDLIDWKSNDEIGSLVSEYNKKVLELEKNAIKLAKSERESAWREMAKQVAHEIKNPLTPMKLSIQHLQKSAKDNPDELHNRFKRTANILIEQIDKLSTIANEFSNFAKMPKAYEEIIDLLPIITSAIQLYKQEGGNDIFLETNSLKKVNIIADKDQMSSVFSNLIKNGIQAIPKDRKGKIHIDVSEKDDYFLIAIKDNGMGIPEDKKDKIFVPNFTTKTTGMGLGLAMVKNILENIDGEIWFNTKEEQGTSFFIELPKA